jgi:hypothetical protein
MSHDHHRLHTGIVFETLRTLHERVAQDARWLQIGHFQVTNRASLMMRRLCLANHAAEGAEMAGSTAE